MSVKVLYSTSATATGGRDGEARTTDGSFAVKLATPKGRALHEKAKTVPHAIACAAGEPAEALHRLKDELVALRDRLNASAG